MVWWDGEGEVEGWLMLLGVRDGEECGNVVSYGVMVKVVVGDDCGASGAFW